MADVFGIQSLKKGLFIFACLALVSCSGGGGGSADDTPSSSASVSSSSPGIGEPSPPSLVSSVFSTDAKVSRFLGKATFGATQADIERLTGTEVSDWFKAELEKPNTKYLPIIEAQIATLEFGEILPRRSISDVFFDKAIAGEDQLRQRMIFALSQIIVVSNSGDIHAPIMADYVDILSDNAFGNYRDLLEDITYSPAMAIYLTYIASRKGDAGTGRVPDENYAREVLQLFTIGLKELNLDGTEKLGTDGQSIETYDNSDITGLAKVFTGLSAKGSNFFNYRSHLQQAVEPLEIFPAYHSSLEKTFLETTISENTGGVQSIDEALDAIFAHPNVAPFISRQLIQRFTSSHPAPAYVERVATAFETGSFMLPDGFVVGSGERGDLAATIAAVLLDADALLDLELVSTADVGKIREPILRFTNWARAFNETTPDSKDEIFLASMESTGQHPFRSHSVFNFFRPRYIAPGTETGAAGLTVPELQIINESSSMSYINFINAFIYNTAPNVSGNDIGGIEGDYSTELAMADDGQALLDRQDLLLTGNSLGTETKTRILAMMDEVPIRVGSEDSDRLSRVRLATTMVMTAPGYLVQR